VNVRLHVTAGSVIAIGLLLVLAATVIPPPQAGEPGASLTVRLPHTVQTIVLALFGLSAILLLALQRPRRPTEDEPLPSRFHRRSAWAAVSLPLLLLLAAVGYLVWHRRSGQEGDPIERAVTAIAGLLELLRGAGKPSTSIPLFDVTIAAIMVLSGLALLTLLILVALADPLAKWWAGRAAAGVTPQLPDIADGPDDLRTLADPRLAIVRAYGRFERALARAGTPRTPWQTPAEFMRTTVARLPGAISPVTRLTTLLEVARFSDRPLGIEARDTACDCLDEIRTALDAR
jgi:predicted nucleic acid-binding protein